MSTRETDSLIENDFCISACKVMVIKQQILRDVPFQFVVFSLKKTEDRHTLLAYFTKSQPKTPILKALPITKMKGNDSMHQNFIKGKYSRNDGMGLPTEMGLQRWKHIMWNSSYFKGFYFAL